MHIELHRTFHELSQGKGPGTDDDSFYPGGEKLTWAVLLEQSRLVLLSEAGSGKTQEIREAAKGLRHQGKHAFFMRLEHVAFDFESAFEEGTHEEFQTWLASTDDAWLLLDSVDESRLKDVSDFERAIRKVSSRLAAAKQRTHLIITGRAPAWRPATDRNLCESLFPFVAPMVAVNAEQTANASEAIRRDGGGTNAGAFKVFTLDDLSPEQIKLFAEGKGVSDTKAFLNAVERADAWSFTARPQDLEELTEFWNDTGKIGSRFELMQSSIARRLTERDQNRDEARPLTLDRAREGMRLIAAATTLMHQQTICVPDGANPSSGLKVDQILTGWHATERVTLLSRPLFDEAIYGTVRFHHRSVREYLTAEWFAGLLRRDTSRRRVEQLFFRSIYGMDVVVPTLRPILPWLAMLDTKILDRVRRIAPEILFEGGDPSQLPSEVRGDILEQACAQLASGASRRSMADFAAVQRFAAPDLTDKIKDLITRYQGNEDILSFLLRMVWQGRLAGCVREAMGVATNATARRYARIAAFRAIADLGTADDLAKVRQAFVDEVGAFERELLSELIGHATPTDEVLEWLFSCLQRVADVEKYKVDHLSDQLASFVARVDEGDLVVVVDRLNRLLGTPPFVERRHCELSMRFRWLLHPAAVAIERLLTVRHADALGTSALSILHLLPVAKQFGAMDSDDSKFQLGKLVSAWPAAKWALFWHLVAEERRWLDSKKGERLTDWWRATLWPSHVSFEHTDLAQAVQEITSQPLLDDKLVALTLAFRLYVDGGRQVSQRAMLKKATQSSKELAARLQELLHPPRQSAESNRYKRMDAAWRRQAEQRKLREQKNRVDWHRHLVENVEKLRDPGFEDPSAIWSGQHYLFERMREGESTSSVWTAGNWQSLEREFGPDIARAFRDGIVGYWRRNTPQLVSEGAALNSTPGTTIYGLAGATIDARETADWSQQLTNEEAAIAFRYAMHELNGFPPWFSALFEKHKDVVKRLCLREISYELNNEGDGPGSQYILRDVTWAADWLWEPLFPDLFELLRANEPRSPSNLGYLLDILQSSSLPDSLLEQLASVKVRTVEAFHHVAHWLSVWTGVSPDSAINELEGRLEAFSDAGERTKFAMTYATHLLGGRRGLGSKVRGAFRNPLHLKRLYLLIHEHVKRSEDIDRANGGVYSPGLRDEAQDAREHLLALLDAIPGKEAFLMLREISQAHPEEAARPWLALKAKSKAEIDADEGEWSAEQVRDFNDMLERTPSNHRELFDLAVLRLLDFKSDLEEGDSSYADVLKTVSDEIEVRKFIGKWCRDSAHGRYSFPQEEELADAKRPDFRWHGNGFDGPVPTELKLADNWTGPQLFERLETQLGGDYLRDARSSAVRQKL